MIKGYHIFERRYCSNLVDSNMSHKNHMENIQLNDDDGD